MSLYYIIYHSLILISLILSLVAWLQGHKRFLWLTLLLFFTLSVELLSEILINKKIPFEWALHIFVLLEYSLLAAFLSRAIKSVQLRRAIHVSILIFVIISLTLSIFNYHFLNLPDININLEGMLLFCICTYILFNLDIEASKAIYLNPDWWFCIGILIFFGCSFFFYGIYTNLFRIDAAKAMKLYSFINRPLNMILYSSIIIGLLCLIRGKKYISR